MNREIFPVKTIDTRVVLPGSKYIANRLLPLCALAVAPSRLHNVVMNDDINSAIAGLSSLGYQFERVENRAEQAGYLAVYPRKTMCAAPVSLNTAHSGTFSRFVSAVAALESVPVTIDCSAKMATRPMAELFASLRALGVEIKSDNQCLPATITGPISTNYCQLDASRSSQYLSALLLVAPRLTGGLTIEVVGPIVSRAYVNMTIHLMTKMGVVVNETEQVFVVAGGQSYQGIDFTIPGDPVSASYFMAAAAISGGSITIDHFDFDSLQGESGFYRVLEAMGVKLEINGNSLTLIGPAKLRAIEVDMSEMPDAVQTLAVVACFAQGVTRINNIAHLAYKESNRIEDTATELRKTGIRVESGTDFLTIYGGQPEGTTIETHDDHRMAMSMALLGICTPGIVINNAQVVDKSFPLYWQYLSQIGVQNQAESESPSEVR